MRKLLFIITLAAAFLTLTACDNTERLSSVPESFAEMGSVNFENNSDDSGETNSDNYSGNESAYTVITKKTKADGRITVTTEEFNEHGDRVYVKNDDGERHFIYKYDADGNVIECEEPVRRGSYRTVYEYENTDNGSITKITDYDKDGEIEKITTTSYDDHGERISDKTEYPQTALVRYGTRCEIEYDAEGRINAERAYDHESGELSYTITYEYNEHGNKIRSMFENKAYKSTTVYEYDNNGNMVSQTEPVVYNDGRTSSHRWEYTYDTKGRKTLEIYYSQNANGELEEFERIEYEYK